MRHSCAIECSAFIKSAETDGLKNLVLSDKPESNAYRMPFT